MPTIEKDEKVIYFSTPAIAERWACSQNKVISVLEGHRGEKGFMDLGSPENLKDHKRTVQHYSDSSDAAQLIEASM